MLSHLTADHDYVRVGHRVTDAATMAVAVRIFEAANQELCEGLLRAELPAVGFKKGIFMAEVRSHLMGPSLQVTDNHRRWPRAVSLAWSAK